MNKSYPTLSPGDRIVCKDRDDEVSTLCALQLAGVTCDFDFSGEVGKHVLIVVEVEDDD